MKPSANRFKTPQPSGNFFCCWLTVVLLSLAPIVMHGATLNWTPSTDSAVAGFKIYYGPSSRGYTNSLAVGKINSITISGLVAKATYYLVITAFDKAGHESPFSDEISFTVPAPVASNNGVPVTTTSSNVVAKNAPTPTTNPVSSPKPQAAPATTPVAKLQPKNPPASQSQSVAIPPKANPSLSNGTTASPAKRVATPTPTVAKANSNQAGLVAAVQLPLVSAKKVSSASQLPPQKTAVLDAATVLAGNAAALYAAAVSFDDNRDHVLSAPEKNALIKALAGGTTEIFGPKIHCEFSADEAPDVVAWMALLYAQTAAFDAYSVGWLDANEQAALAVALEKGDLALPLFAPLMFSEENQGEIQPPAGFRQLNQ